MQNPFDILEQRLAGIESLLKSTLADRTPLPPAVPPDPLAEFTPVTEIFERKVISSRTFYDRVKEGRIDIYKVGTRSFIRTADFPKLFRKAKS